jgi:hypothetical protein
LRLWDAISVYREREQAASLLARSPRLGAFLAELHIPEDGSIRIDLDNGGDGHCTLWGEPRDLLVLVVSVTPG